MSEPVRAVPARDHALRSAAVPCACGGWTEVERPQERDVPARCERCGATLALAFDGRLDTQGRLDGCAHCDYHTLYVQKDVNPRLGVLLVAVTFAILLVLDLPIPQLVIGLIALTLLDTLLLRAFVKRVLICYRCKAQYRGFAPGESCRPFDLATWEAHTGE